MEEEKQSGALEQTEYPPELLGLRIEQRFAQNKPLLTLQRQEGEEGIQGQDEIKKLAMELERRGAELGRFRGELELETYERVENSRRKINEALDWKDDDFYDLVEEVIGLEGGEIGLSESGEERMKRLGEIRERIKARRDKDGSEKPLMTAGADWKEEPSKDKERDSIDERVETLSPEEKKYIFRCLGVLETMYDILNLCSICGNEELFLPAAELSLAKLQLRLIRGKHSKDGVAVRLRDEGFDYGQVRPIPPGGLHRIIKALFLKKPEFGPDQEKSTEETD